MTRIESELKSINKPDTTIFDFLADLNNLENLMPDRVKSWESTEDSCYFTIEGTASLGMKIIERKAHSFIKMVDDGKVPFKFDFLVNIEKVDDSCSNVKIFFDADMNPMLQMLAKTPLTNFLNILLDNLANTDLV